jgi:serine/threonine-protein kinase
VLVSTDGRIKLGDFGIGKIVEGSVTPSLLSFRTATGALLGTPAYMSPEAAEQGVKQLSPAADLYSLAVLSYQLLVGVLPFPIGPDILATLEAHRAEPPPAPRLRAPGFPETVEKVLLRGLAKQPERRQPSVSTFAIQLRVAATDAWPELEHGGSDLVRVVGLAREAERSPSTLLTGDGAPTASMAARSMARVQAPVFRPRRRTMSRGVAASVGLGVLTAGVVLLILYALHL